MPEGVRSDHPGDGVRKLVALVAVGIVVCSLAASAAVAAGKKKAKPVLTTMYAHGPSQVGEIDGAMWVASVFPTTSPLTLDAEEPPGELAKSQSIATPAINSQCTGTPIANPVFEGRLQGKITGDLKLVAHFLSAPGTITARLWTDIPIFGCNDAYTQPDAIAEVTLPSGQGEVEAVFADLNLVAKSQITIQILAEDVVNGYEGQVGRLLYDSTDAPTRLEFKCIPARGSSCL